MFGKTILAKNKTSQHRISPQAKLLYANNYCCQSLA